ncbi:MAG: recombinase family protein [Acidobacteriia bacterium]|nr:recombinase family protein [Terriglobia bacterium]
MTTIRTAFYARVSGEQQAAAHTIESQIAVLSERASNDGTPVPPERRFVDDGYSGATLIRPALDRLRDLVSVGAIDRIYVHSPDRLARNYAYQVLLLDEWQRRGIEVVFLNRPLGKSPEDDLLLQVQGIVAEYERAKIMERSRRGKKHAAQGGSVNVMSGAPFGYRYVSVQEGGGQARFEPVDGQARVVKQIFAWVAEDRCSLSEVCRRLEKAGELTATRKPIWSRQAVWHVLQNPAYRGQAAYGKTHMMPRGKQARPRAARGRPSKPHRSNRPVEAGPQEWVYISVPALVDAGLFRAAHAQLDENRSRARQGRRRPGYLLQGLTCCALCGYAYYGKTIRQLGAGRQMKDFIYYRCSGSDGYRFGGEPICRNRQVEGKFLETAVWQQVCELLTNPRRLEQEYKGRDSGAPLERLESLKAQRLKLQHAVERLIDGFTAGLIDKEQFTLRMDRTKERITDLDAKIKADTGDVSRLDNLRWAVQRVRDLSTAMGADLTNADWHRRREIIRTLIQQIDINTEMINVIFRLTQNDRGFADDSIVISVPRP